MVRTERYKYVIYDKGRYREQLFDMQADRGETRNLMMERAYEEVAQQHRDILAQFMEEHHVRPTRPALHDVPGKVLKRKAKAADFAAAFSFSPKSTVLSGRCPKQQSRR